jgi:hypothetical protein
VIRNDRIIPYFIGSALTQHAKGSHSIQGLLAVNIPVRSDHDPPHAMSPRGAGRHPVGPLEPFASVTCYLTSTQ